MNGLLKIALFGMFLGLTFGMIFGYMPMQVKLFKQSIQNSSRVTNCAGCDFRGVQDLAGVDAHGVHMPGVTAQPCQESDMNKDNPAMICIKNQISNFKGTNFANSNLSKSCFDYTILDNANLSGVDFSESSVVNASMRNAKVTGIITKNSTFCQTIMPDGAVCKDVWKGQGVTINCNCFDTELAKKQAAENPDLSQFIQDGDKGVSSGSRRSDT